MLHLHDFNQSVILDLSRALVLFTQSCECQGPRLLKELFYFIIVVYPHKAHASMSCLAALWRSEGTFKWKLKLSLCLNFILQKQPVFFSGDYSLLSSVSLELLQRNKFIFWDSAAASPYLSHSPLCIYLRGNVNQSLGLCK